jgi:hypothetical protein
MAGGGLRIGPLDPSTGYDARDNAVSASLVGDATDPVTAQTLIEQGREMNPPELRAAGALPRNEPRTTVLDLDEVEKAVRKAVKANEGIDVDESEVVLEGASVRGDRPGRHVVLYLVRYPSGRTQRGFLPYDAVPNSRKAGDQAGEAARQSAHGGGNLAAQVDELREQLSKLTRSRS